MQAAHMHAVQVTLPVSLPAFLEGRRWFGGKNRTITGVSLSDYVWLQTGPRPDALALVDVSYGDAGRERYALWVGVRDAPEGRPVVGRVPDGPWIVDVSADPECAPALLQRFVGADDLLTERGGVVRAGDVTSEAAAILRRCSDVRALGVDQSNTSLAIDRAIMFKLFRRLQPGENPEIEIGRFLTTRTAFRECSLLRGSITWVAADGTPYSIGVLQAWIDNTGDGWRYVQDCLTQHLATPGSWATARRDLFTLGATTARFHLALACDRSQPAFAPEPFAAAEISRWGDALTRLAAHAHEYVADARLSDDERRRLARALGLVASADPSVLPPLAERVSSWSGIRVHGDYHLGQTLRTREGFAIIDFEGEPARTIEERRSKHCALKDVAGMLRSFEYALAVACAGAPERMDALRADLGMAPAFLAGYYSAADAAGASFLPSEPGLRARWLRFFEIEKALYELDYEFHNRPDWVRIPARGLVALLDA